MQRTGLEWLHRVLESPGRYWRRYLLEDLAFFPLVVAQRMRLALRRQVPRPAY